MFEQDGNENLNEHKAIGCTIKEIRGILLHDDNCHDLINKIRFKMEDYILKYENYDHLINPLTIYAGGEYKQNITKVTRKALIKEIDAIIKKLPKLFNANFANEILAYMDSLKIIISNIQKEKLCSRQLLKS